MQLAEKNNINEYWVSNEIKKDSYYFYKKNCDEWRCAINTPFDKYGGIAHYEKVRRGDMDHVIKFVINGRSIRGCVNFYNNELTYELTTTRIMWALIEGIDEMLELKRQEFLDQQNLNNVVEVNDENLISETK